MTGYRAPFLFALDRYTKNTFVFSGLFVQIPISFTEISHQNRLFWLLNIGGWLAFAAIAYLAGRFYGEQWGMLEYRLAAAAVGIVGGGLLREVYRRTWHLGLGVRAAVAVVASYIMAIPMTLAANWALDCFNTTYFVMTGANYLKNLLAYFYHFFGWSALYFALKFYRDFLAEQARREQATQLARDAQLKMLRYQLNPHFLFNTLNAISTLILEKQTEPANAMVMKLSEFLRQSLTIEPTSQVSLKQEIVSLRLYLDIEKERFAERLQVAYDVSPQAEAAQVPAMILQPLVENAIKYAIAPSESGGTIVIAAAIESDQLHLQITDNGPGAGSVAQAGCGVGLGNCQSRLQALYGDNFQLSFGNNEQGSGFTVKIILPIDQVLNNN